MKLRCMSMTRSAVRAGSIRWVSWMRASLRATSSSCDGMRPTIPWRALIPPDQAGVHSPRCKPPTDSPALLPWRRRSRGCGSSPPASSAPSRRSYDESRGSPVFTVKASWTSRGWTEWTQGFQYGSALLQFDATGEQEFLAGGRRKTHERMAPAPHAHGRARPRLQQRQHLRRPAAPDERGPDPRGRRGARRLRARAEGERGRAGAAMDADRRTGAGSSTPSTARTRCSWTRCGRCGRWRSRTSLGHVLLEENDRRVSLLERLVQHAAATARYSVYYGEGRDAYDVSGRVAHESIFNVNDGSYRCPGTQQGYSPFTTWTRGLAWAILGFAEELEFLGTLPRGGPRARWAASRRSLAMLRRAAQATAEFYLAHTAVGRHPLLGHRGAGAARSSELARAPGRPVQRPRARGQLGGRHRLPGPLRGFGKLAARRRESTDGERYPGAGLDVLSRLLEEPYLSTSRGPPGAAPALRVSPAERLGPRAGGARGPLRRVQHVGRLPPARGGAARAAADRRRRAAHVLERKGRAMTIADLSTIEGRTYPAGRRTQNLVGGASPIQANGFCMGYVTLEPDGGQVPWHNHPQEEVYFIVRGTAEACVGGGARGRRHRAGAVRPPEDLPPAHEPRDRADGDALRLLARRRRGALAPGAGRLAAAGGRGGAAASRGRPAAAGTGAGNGRGGSAR